MDKPLDMKGVGKRKDTYCHYEELGDITADSTDTKKIREYYR